jgi:hypothetical protein
VPRRGEEPRLFAFSRPFQHSVKYNILSNISIDLILNNDIIVGVVIHLFFDVGSGVLDDFLKNNSLSNFIKQIRQLKSETNHMANCEYLRDIRHQYHHEPRLITILLLKELVMNTDYTIFPHNRWQCSRFSVEFPDSSGCLAIGSHGFGK